MVTIDKLPRAINKQPKVAADKLLVVAVDIQLAGVATDTSFKATGIEEFGRSQVKHTTSEVTATARDSTAAIEEGTTVVGDIGSLATL